MAKSDNVVLEGTVIAMKGAKFVITCDNGLEVLGTHSGWPKKHRIRVIVGDRVKIQLSPYDMSHGLITRRL